MLKADTCPVFDPPLPPRKLQAVARLGFGTLNKVGGVQEGYGEAGYGV